jgi:hypothetical protein
VSSWRDREARQRALFRHVNGRVAALRDPVAAEGLASFICECGNADCTEPIQVTTAEYEAVRAHARRFAIAFDHENPSSRSSSAKPHGSRSWKLVRDSSRIAEETDPRADRGG